MSFGVTLHAKEHLFSKIQKITPWHVTCIAYSPRFRPRREAVIFQSGFLAHFLISMLSYVILTHFACIIALGFQNSKIHSVSCTVPSLYPTVSLRTKKVTF